MTITRLNINGKQYRQQDFLDLILALQDEKSINIVVSYRDGKSIDLKRKTIYQKNLHTGEWIMTSNKGKPCSQRVRVTKENRQHIIQYF